MELKEYVSDFYSGSFKDVKEQRVRIEEVVKLIGSKKRVLDVGSWDGSISAIIRAQGNWVVGVDISKGASKQAREKIDVMLTDINSGMAIKDGSFDVVFMGDVLEHIFDTNFVLNEAHRALNKDGILIITMPNACSIRDRILSIFGHLPAFYGAHEDHIRLFNKKKLLSRLSDKFETVSFKGWKLEIIISPYGHKIAIDRITKRFASLATHFIVVAKKR